MASAIEKRAGATGGETTVAFHELTSPSRPLDNTSLSSASKLWENTAPDLRGAVTTTDLDHDRLQLRALEAIISPTCSADRIMRALVYAVTSQGLRVLQRDEQKQRIVAQRIEAPYLAHLSSGSRSSSSLSGVGEREQEWRVVMATLGVSKGFAAWGGVERVLLLSFITDPCPKQTDLAGRSAAAVASLLGSVASAAAGFGARGGGGGRGDPSSNTLSKESGVATGGGTNSVGGSSAPLSPVAIANLRSKQRADALVEAVVAGLDRLGCGTSSSTSSSVTSSAKFSSKSSQPVSARGKTMLDLQTAPEAKLRSSTSGDCENNHEEKVGGRGGSHGGGSGDSSCALTGEDADFPGGDAAGVVLAPFEGSIGGGVTKMGATEGSPLSGASLFVVVGKEGAIEVANGSEGWRQLVTERAGRAGLPSDEGRNEIVEVSLCLQFAEAVCARAEVYSRRDASEAWRPLEEAIERLERDNAHLRSLLEARYHAVGVNPPHVPAWSAPEGFGNAHQPGPGAEPLRNRSTAGASGGKASLRAAVLLRSNSLFVIDAAWIKTRVLIPGYDLGIGDPGSEQARDDCSPPNPDNESSRASNSERHQQQDVSFSPSAVKPQATTHVLGAQPNRVLVRAVVKAFAQAVGSACEAREELYLKAHLPQAHTYVTRLEEYRTALIGGNPVRGLAAGSGRGGGDQVEIDDDLWRLFSVRETRLYSSSAALGKKPGRIYLTFGTLWFHSKVLGFESRHIQPLVNVRSVTLLGTALDLSSSLVIVTKDGGELMLVFPGQRTANLEPFKLLIQHLVMIASEETNSRASDGSSGHGGGVQADSVGGVSGDDDVQRGGVAATDDDGGGVNNSGTERIFV